MVVRENVGHEELDLKGSSGAFPQPARAPWKQDGFIEQERKNKEKATAHHHTSTLSDLKHDTRTPVTLSYAASHPDM